MEAATAAVGVERYPRRWLAPPVMIGAAAVLAPALPKTAVDPSAVFVADVDSEVVEP